MTYMNHFQVQGRVIDTLNYEQELKISLCYIHHVLSVILWLMETFNNIFEIIIHSSKLLFKRATDMNHLQVQGHVTDTLNYEQQLNM